MRRTLCLSFVAMGLFAQEGETSAECLIEGRVLDASTGEPVPKTLLVLEDMRQETASAYSAISDATGRFAISDIEPGRYRLSALRNGFVVQYYGARSPRRNGAPIMLEPGKHLRDVVLRLTRHGAISGRILDEDGEPLARAQVQAFRRGYVRGRRQMTPVDRAVTNDLGEYRLFGLTPGQYLIGAGYNGMWPPEATPLLRKSGNSESDMVYVPRYYPGTADPGQTNSIEISPGADVRGIDVTLRGERSVRVSGRIVNMPAGCSEKQSGWRPTVHLAPQDSSGDESWRRINAPIDSRGHFEIPGVTPGSYTVRGQCYDGAQNYFAHESIVVEQKNIDGLALMSEPAPELTGKIRVEGETDKKLSSLGFELTSSNGAVVGGKVQQDGTFNIQLSPDIYTLSISDAPPDFYIKSVEFGGRDLLASGIDLTHGSGGLVEVVLNPNGGRVEGVVLDDTDQPAVGTSVVLAPAVKRRDWAARYKTATTDQHGRFSLQTIAPGSYKLFAFEEMEDQAYLDPEFLKPFDKLGTRLDIDERGRESISLKMIATR